MGRTAVLTNFIHRVKKVGMPVKMLSYVNSNYRVVNAGPGGQNETNVWFNQIHLSEQVHASVDVMSWDGVGGQESGLDSVYHECTHAYFDLKESDSEVSALLQKGRKYYAAGRLEDGSKVTDPERVVQEAAAEYVAHRARTYWQTGEKLTYVQGRVSQLKDATKLERLREIAKKAPSSYNQGMAKRLFGYQYVGGGWFRPGSVVSVNRVIMPALRVFCDNVLLERALPDRFAQAKILAAAYQKLQLTFSSKGHRR